MIQKRNCHTLALAMLMFVADKATGGGTATASKASTPAPSPAPGAQASPAPAPAAGAKAAPQPKIHDKLLVAVQGYDQHIQEAESYYVQMIELVLTEKISRADVVATLMRARGITFETAQSQYSRMKKMWEKPEILDQLKKGEITLKVAREATKSTQAGGKGQGDGSAGTGSKTQETKEARYDRVRKAHVAAVKECGFEKKSAMLSFEADLNAAGVK